ncbi:MAG: ATP-binding protein [Thermoplasmata archaeon]
MALAGPDSLPSGVEAVLRASNPWWDGRPGRPVPPFQRWPFEMILRRLTDKARLPAVVLRGPRQVGKTTLQEQIIEKLVTSEASWSKRILRVQFDDLPSLRTLTRTPSGPEVILRISRWFEANILGATLNERAREGAPAILMLDEVQNLPDWGVQVKSLVDTYDVRVLVTGSSALRLRRGEDSLAGRLTSIELGPLTLREIAGINQHQLLPIPDFFPTGTTLPLSTRDFWEGLRAFGLQNRVARDGAFQRYDDRGGYPMSHLDATTPWETVAPLLYEAIVKRAIQHDLRLGERGRRRDPQLLAEVFRLCCKYAGQAPGPATLAEEIRASVPGSTVSTLAVGRYMDFFDETLLVRLVHQAGFRLKKRRGYPKLSVCDPALRAATLQERVPLVPAALEAQPELASLAGFLAESVLGYLLMGIVGADLSWLPKTMRDPEVDFILSTGTHHIPIELKYRGAIHPAEDTKGLLAFLDRGAYSAPFGILVTREDTRPDGLDPRIVDISLRSFLLIR